MAIGDLHSLYVGSSDLDGDLAVLLALPGATKKWRYQRFGADVACVVLANGTRVMLADHRPAGSVIVLVEVASLDDLRAPEGATTHDAETPDGTCRVLTLPGGATLGAIHVVRRNALDR